MHVAPFTPALYRTYHHLGTNEKIGRNCLVLYRVAPPELSWTDVKKFSRNREPRISKKAKKKMRAINTGNYSSRIKSIRPLCRLRVHGLLAVSLLFKPDSIRINNDLDSARTSMHGVTTRFNFCCFVRNLVLETRSRKFYLLPLNARDLGRKIDLSGFLNFTIKLP